MTKLPKAPSKGEAVYLLPIPPSANNLFAGKQRRWRSKGYERWIKSVAFMLMACGPQPKIAGKVEVIYEYGRFKDKRRRDLLNREKALTDLLVKLGKMDDDSLIEKATLSWTDDIEEGFVRATIRSVA